MAQWVSIRGRQGRVSPAMLAGCILLCALVSGLEPSHAAQGVCPVRFEQSDSVQNTPYETYRLAATVREEAGKRVVLEVEDASRLILTGAERLALMDDAGGKVAAWQIQSMEFDFETLGAGKYTMWLRCKANPKSPVVGPHHEQVEGATYLHVPTTNRTDKLGGWMWVKGATRELAAGKHHWSLWGDLFLYGTLVDRIVVTRDEAFHPSDEDPGPPPSPAAEIRRGSAVSSILQVKGARQWLRIAYREVPSRGVVGWAYRIEGTDEWKNISKDDLREIPVDKPFRLKMTLDPSGDSKPPILDTVRLQYEGEPLKREIAPGLIYRALESGGCVVTTPAYRVTFSENGRIASLKMGQRELIASGDSGWSGSWLEFNRWGSLQQVELAAPDLTPDGAIAVRAEEATQLFTFKEDEMVAALSTHGGERIVGPGSLAYAFNLNSNLDLDRIVERSTGKVVAKGENGGNAPQVFFKDGASFYLLPTNTNLPGFTSCFAGPEGAVTFGFWLNTANIISDSIVFRPEPVPADALQMDISCSTKDHVYRWGEPIQVKVDSRVLYNLSYKGQAKLTLTKQYADKGQEETFEAMQAIAVPAGKDRTAVTWDVSLKSPGLYGGKYELLEDSKVVRQLSFVVLYAAEKLTSPPPPEDFGAFWKQAMDKLAQVPVTYDTQSSEKREGYLFSRIEFESIEGRPAWGNLAEPEEDGKYPAILKLPPVGTQAPGIDLRTERGFVVLGVEVFGHDPHWPQEKINEFLARGGVRYEPLEAKGKGKPEDFWHYYAYCTLARAYDLLESHPKVDRDRIYITGISQGGGLTLAAAGLRPQNAGAVAVVPGLCRLDWANANGGAWGPRIPRGADFDSMVRMLEYFETAYLVRNLRSRLVMSVGLFDDHTPPHAAASVFNEVPLNIRERKLIVGPWIGHSGVPELEIYIPRWAKEDRRP